MMAESRTHLARGAALALTAFLLVSAPVSAQRVSLSSGFEHGGDDLNLLYSQISFTRDGIGWMPVGAVSAYWLSPGPDSDDVWSFKPSVGMRYRTGEGYFQGSVGYSFKTNDDVVGPNFFDVSGSGVTTGVHGEYWGDGTWAGQAIASVNWGSEYMWSRVRGLRRVATPAAGGGVLVGAEYVWQGDIASDVDPKVSTVQAGPVVQWVTPGGAVWALSGGYKDVNLQDESTYYVKVELSLGLGR